MNAVLISDKEDEILAIVLGSLLAVCVVVFVVLTVGYFTCFKRFIAPECSC